MNGMDDNEDDDSFLDDALDALPGNALLELEHEAIRSTQQDTVAAGQTCGQVNDNQHNPRSALHLTAPSRVLGPQNGVSRPSHRQPVYSVYEQYDKDQLDTAGAARNNDATLRDERDSYFQSQVLGDVIQRENWRQAQYGRPSKIARVRPPGRSTTSGADQAAVENGHSDRLYDVNMQDSMLLGDHPTRTAHAAVSKAEETLRTRIVELLREREIMEKELQNAKSTVLTQSGEIAIIRANRSKEATIHQRQLAALRRSMEEDALKHRLHVEKVGEENKRIATENLELGHELALEAEKVKRIQHEHREKSKNEKANVNLTPPRRAHSLPFRDGFDDGPVMAVSPSKRTTPSKGTPSAGAKRKRRVENTSPIKPLVLRQASSGQRPGEEEPLVMVPREPLEKHETAARNSLRFMQRMLNHRSPTATERIVEVFTKLAFPSNPTKAFSTIVLEATAGLASASLPSDFLKLIISLWSQSLDEKYYEPVAILIDIVQFAIALDGEVVTAEIVTQFLPVLKSSCDINGMPRFLHSPVSQNSCGQFHKTPQEAINQWVDGTACLEILYSLACACLENERLLRLVWQTMDFEFILMMLNASQPVAEISLSLNLLSTSIMPNTFGIICKTWSDQNQLEAYIVDRVSWLLWETPREDEGSPRYTDVEVSELRVEAMELLTTLALSPIHPHDNPNHHGSILVANHATAIGRICRCMYDEIDALYDYRPGHELHAKLVNDATRLVYHMLQLHGDSIDMQQKLEVVNGGVQKHRVVLTRLAFSEGLFLEAGITDETVMMAHEMLEDSVTPEEAEMLGEVFPAYKGRKGGSPPS